MAWRVIAFGFLLNLSSAFGQTHFVSLFNAQVREAFSLGHGDLGLLYSAATLCSAVLMPWAGRRIDSADLRIYAAAVIFGLGLAAWLMSAAAAVWHLFAAFFMLRLFGQGLSSHTGFTTTARLATAHRGKSISVAGLGMSIGEAIAPPLVAFMLVFMTWRDLWAAAAAFQVIAVLGLAQLLLRGLSCSPPASRGASADEADGASWTRAQVLRDARFWAAAPALFAPPCVVTALFFHQHSLAEYKEVEFSLWTTGVAAYSAGSVIASLAAGTLVDKFGGRRVVKWALPPLIMSTLLAAQASFPGLSFAYYFLMGMSAGVSVPSVNALWVEMYGRAHLGAVRSLAHAMMVLLSAAGPVAYGLLLDAGMPWPSILHLTAAAMVAAMITIWLTPLRFRPPPAPSQKPRSAT